MNTGQLIFSLGLPVLIYLLSSAVARGWKRLELKVALLYVSSVAMMGVFGEIFVGSVYEGLVGRHLWDYTLWPVHGGFTSMYAPYLWGCYGFYLYLSHGTLRRYNIHRQKHLALIFAAETVVLEAVTNGLYRLLTGEYLFYYTPSDLWHLTSFQAMPFYLIAGFAIVKYVTTCSSSPRLYSFMNAYLALVVVFLA